MRDEPADDVIAFTISCSPYLFMNRVEVLQNYFLFVWIQTSGFKQQQESEIPSANTKAPANTFFDHEKLSNFKSFLFYCSNMLHL